jgi:signal transduction histidine kinase
MTTNTCNFSKIIFGNNEQQRGLTTAVVAIHEQERSLISQELPDNINQVLNSAKLYAGVGDAAAMMDKSITLVQTAIDETRKLSRQLSVYSLTYQNTCCP